MENITVVPTSHRVIAGITYAVFNLIAMMGNMLVLVVLYFRWKYFKMYSFYVLVFCLAIGDSLFILANIFVQVPETAFGTWSVFEQYPNVHNAITSLNSFAFGWSTSASFLMSLDRFVVFMLPGVNAKTFAITRRCTAIGMCISSAHAVIMYVTPFALGIIKTFNTDSFHWQFVVEQPANPLALLYLGYVSWYVGALGALMLAFYVIVYAKLYHQRKSNLVNTNHHVDKHVEKRKKVERSMLFQGSLISTVAILQAIAFSLIQRGVFSDYGWFAPVIGQCMSIINAGVNAYIYLAFNRLFLDQTRILFGFGNTVQPMTHLKLTTTNNHTHDKNNHGGHIHAEHTTKF